MNILAYAEVVEPLGVCPECGYRMIKAEGNENSGCNPAAAEANGNKCGRPPKEDKPKGPFADVVWFRVKQSMRIDTHGGKWAEFEAWHNGHNLRMVRRDDPENPGKFLWHLYVDGYPMDQAVKPQRKFQPRHQAVLNEKLEKIKPILDNPIDRDLARERVQQAREQINQANDKAKEAAALARLAQPNAPVAVIDQVEKEAKEKALKEAKPEKAPKRPVGVPNIPNDPVRYGQAPGVDDDPLARLAITSMKPLGEADNKGVNASFKATLEDGSTVLIKTARGEDNRLTGLKPLKNAMMIPILAPLYPREAAASDIGKELGLEHLVPKVVIRDVPGHGIGMQQQWWEISPAGNFGKYNSDWRTAKSEANWNASGPIAQRYWAKFDQQTAHDAAAFDYITRGVDRHGGNYIVDDDKDGRHTFKLFDHGLSFSRRWGNDHMDIYKYVKKMSPSIPTTVQDRWKDKWPAIEKVMRHRMIAEKDIKMTKVRYDNFMAASSYNDLNYLQDGLREAQR